MPHILLRNKNNTTKKILYQFASFANCIANIVLEFNLIYRQKRFNENYHHKFHQKNHLKSGTIKIRPLATENIELLFSHCFYWFLFFRFLILTIFNWLDFSGDLILFVSTICTTLYTKQQQQKNVFDKNIKFQKILNSISFRLVFVWCPLFFAPFKWPPPTQEYMHSIMTAITSICTHHLLLSTTPTHQFMASVSGVASRCVDFVVLFLGLSV